MAEELFGVLDFETYEWVNTLCVGLVYNTPVGLDEDFYLDRESPEKVVDYALQCIHLLSREGVKRWWAHNGGKFDYLFILSRALERGWHAQANVAAGRIVRLELYPPDGSKKRIVLNDSFAVIPSSLKKALVDFGIKAQKEFGDADYKEDMRLLSDARLRSGCLADCHATYLLVDKVRADFENWGGALKGTFSASALSVLKSHLAEEIPSHEGIENIQTLARESFFGGRVEIFHHSPIHYLAEYDINSSYPAAMLRSFPWKFIGKVDGDEAQRELNNDATEGIFLADVSCPTGMVIPILPYRNDGMFFPTGEWQGWFAKPELLCAIREGYRVSISSALVYTKEYPFTAFIDKLYSARLKSVGAEKNFLKLVMNGCYGKFAQKPEKKKLMLFPTEAEGMAYAEFHPCELISSDWRFLVEDAFAWAPHTHYAIASYVTAYARIKLWSFLMEGKDGLAYCDTDSIHTRKSPNLDRGCNVQLGALKLEHEAFRGNYFAPKLYSQEMDAGKVEYASKGFEVDRETFEKVVTGLQVKSKSQMTLLKTQLRQDNKVTIRESLKKWSGRSMKRYAYKNGATRAWSVVELERGDHLNQLSPLYTMKGEVPE